MTEPGRDCAPLCPLIQQAVCVEHDPVRDNTLAWQRHSSGRKSHKRLWEGREVSLNPCIISTYTSSLRLVPMSDPRHGPRIGMVHDCHFYQHFFDTGSTPPLGLRRDEYSNSGVFLIRPGEAPFLAAPHTIFCQTRKNFSTFWTWSGQTLWSLIPGGRVASKSSSMKFTCLREWIWDWKTTSSFTTFWWQFRANQNFIRNKHF